MRPVSSASKILAYLQTGARLTTESASFKFGISPDGARARFNEIKQAGYPIYGNRENGTVVYRLGSPSQRVIAAGNFLLSNQTLNKRYAKQIDQNIARVART